jgi:hypothetical protein
MPPQIHHQTLPDGRVVVYVPSAKPKVFADQDKANTFMKDLGYGTPQ